MIIKLSPQRRDDALTVTKAGDVLTINGEAFDFSVVPDGGYIPSEAIICDFISGNVERVGGELVVPLILPHGRNPSQAQAFPANIVNPADGEVVLP